MATTQADVDRWCDDARKKKCTHLMVVCDTFDYEDYPVCIYQKGSKARPSYEWDDIDAARKHYSTAPMQRIMEVIDLRSSLVEELTVKKPKKVSSKRSKNRKGKIMPHDSRGQLLKNGDVVTMSFTVKDISQNEKACNVRLEAIATDASKANGEDYLPSMTCNTTLATKIEPFPA